MKAVAIGKPLQHRSLQCIVVGIVTSAVHVNLSCESKFNIFGTTAQEVARGWGRSVHVIQRIVQVCSLVSNIGNRYCKIFRELLFERHIPGIYTWSFPYIWKGLRKVIRRRRKN